MKERGMLFSAPMVQALLTDSKTQTRRAVKPQPVASHGWVGGAYWERRSATLTRPVPEQWSIRDVLQFCPHGQVGDRIWVRETWQIDAPHDGTWASTQFYGCKGTPLSEIPERFRHPAYCLYSANWLHGQIKWRPSLLMPRWASRITLEITEVRVERLQDISEADALAEGIVQLLDGGFGLTAGEHYHAADPRISYWSLWDAINGQGSAESNPWVWRVAFRRLP